MNCSLSNWRFLTVRIFIPSQECDPEKQESDIRKTIQQWEAELGPDHPSITSLVGSLASLLEGQGRWQEAEQVHRRTLAKELQLVGRNHPNTAKALQSIARCMMARSAYAEAEGLLEEAMKVRAGRLGPGWKPGWPERASRGVSRRNGSGRALDSHSRKTVEVQAGDGHHHGERVRRGTGMELGVEALCAATGLPEVSSAALGTCW